MRKLILITLVSILSFELASGQGLYSPGQPKDDGRFAASTKQVNQFFRRFNAEESIEGDKRYYEGDPLYRDRELRGKFISILFDNETSSVDADTKKQFLNEVLSEQYPQYIHFHREDWFAEVSAVFMYKGKRENVTLFMKIQPEGLGYEWVIDKVVFQPFKDIFKKPQGDGKGFLHPLSHELGFMNLRKAFQDSDTPEAYTSKEYTPDYLTLFLYEMKKGSIKFETIQDVKFHFFQVNNWYFELNQFNRPGFNTGWLISNLVRLKPGDKESIQKYIYDQK
ncbi:hypothetical protein A33Q_3590 [Indibacter alkaliphilus LW1]|jgi:hypothetical protein|uniref:Uncharacterized protein n=1 Tax=Indibacter alkaliphilus (strain CCUG 57479 / KCTC 22604 / LW1) TaxID=1189612 RepID=S2D415_INDAL|nr:hypothetical protein [Indibacter alkaliphilus]EOZ93644.1 hypothetical protein A33Q_3590 [Indibacter alkaliphilus LW1]